MLGAVGRYTQNERCWWAFGVLADVTPNNDVVLPYIGAAWSINDHWTLNMLMPWPALLYAPNRDVFFRLGASPSGASWSARPGDKRVEFNLDSWDFGLRVEKRVFANVWLGIEGGIGGLRGLRLTGGEVVEPEFESESAGFLALVFNVRPGALQ